MKHRTDKLAGYHLHRNVLGLIFAGLLFSVADIVFASLSLARISGQGGPEVRPPVASVREADEVEKRPSTFDSRTLMLLKMMKSERQEVRRLERLLLEKEARYAKKRMATGLIFLLLFVGLGSAKVWRTKTGARTPD